MIPGQTTDHITYEAPKKYTPTNIIYHEPLSNELRTSKRAKASKSILDKAKKFLEKKRIEQIDYSSWLCHPIQGYNKTIYTIRSTKEGFVCDCQGFRKKTRDYEAGDTDIKPICSHIVAINQFCFIEAHQE